MKPNPHRKYSNFIIFFTDVEKHAVEVHLDFLTSIFVACSLSLKCQFAIIYKSDFAQSWLTPGPCGFLFCCVLGCVTDVARKFMLSRCL